MFLHCLLILLSLFFFNFLKFSCVRSNVLFFIIIKSIHQPQLQQNSQEKHMAHFFDLFSSGVVTVNKKFDFLYIFFFFF